MASVLVTQVIRAPTESVWNAIRDFNALTQWHPMVGSSHIEDDLPSTTIGCVRNFQLADGGATLREQLLGLCDRRLECTYSILDSLLPVVDYVATLRLIHITEGEMTLGHWSSTFEIAQDADERETVDVIAGIYRAGLSRLVEMFSRS